MYQDEWASPDCESDGEVPGPHPTAPRFLYSRSSERSFKNLPRVVLRVYLARTRDV
jgi:hypothetical protein